MSEIIQDACIKKSLKDNISITSEIDSLSDNINRNKQMINYEEFIWKINNFISVRTVNKWIDSDVFYTHKHGYKMQLRLLPRVMHQLGEYGLSLFPNCTPTLTQYSCFLNQLF